MSTLTLLLVLERLMMLSKLLLLYIEDQGRSSIGLKGPLERMVIDMGENWF